MKYLFPFAIIPKSASIVLYGASDVGYDFYRQIKCSGFAVIVAWLDRNFEMYRMLDLPVDSPELINTLKYDYVVIAVLEQGSYLSVRDYLIGIGIEEDKIIWSPGSEVGYDIARKYSPENVMSDAGSAKETDPAVLVDDDRLDVVVRYLYAKEILQGMKDGYGQGLYEKMFDVLNHATEPTDHFLFRYFSDYDEKKGISTFKDSFRKVIFSIRDQGFRKNCFIPLGRNGRMINGSHRCAAALATGKRIWVREYPIEGVRLIDHRFGEDWFKEAGFSEADMEMIRSGYMEIKQNSKAGGI